MSTHIDDLRALRSLSVQKRRQLVRELAHPDDRGSAQDVRDLFLKLQTTIEAIDRALADERADAAGQPWPLDASRKQLGDLEMAPS
jgi:hypothetical protein